MRRVRRYLSIHKVSEGMTLASPIRLKEGGVLRYSLPEGHALTEDNLRQMQLRRAEFIPVKFDDMRSDEERCADVDAAVRRLQEIFRLADQKAEAITGLYNSMIAYRESQ